MSAMSSGRTIAAATTAATSPPLSRMLPQGAKTQGISFETAIIERYRRRESSVEKALIEMYLTGASVRRVEDITEALRSKRVLTATAFTGRCTWTSSLNTVDGEQSLSRAMALFESLLL